MNPYEQKCIRCAALGAFFAICAVAIIVITTRDINAESGYPTQSDRTGAGWIEPADEYYPKHGYILQHGDGTTEHIDIDRPRQRPRFEPPHLKYQRKWQEYNRYEDY